MRDASDAFLLAVRRSHTVVSRVELWLEGAQEVESLPIVSGSVTMDRTANVRRRCTATVSSTGTFDRDLLYAPGAELRSFRGIRYPNGSEEHISLGRTRIEEVDRSADEATFELTAYDWAQAVIEDQFPGPRLLQSPSTVSMIQTLISEAVPGSEFRVDPTIEDIALPETPYEPDRWDAVNSMGKALAAEVFYDADGFWRIWSPPDPAGAVDWPIRGGLDGVLVSQSDVYSRADTYNGVVMTSETLKGGKPVRAFVVDDDPASPTYWDGPFGHKILFTDVPPIAGTSDDDIIQRAEKAARAVLSEYKGSARELSFASVPNPAVEVGDIIEVEIGGVVQTHVLDTLSVPLGASGSLEGGSRLGREV